MDSDIISVNTLMDQEKVAEIIKDYDINSVPVVDSENKLVGIITIDDVIDIIEEEVIDSLQFEDGKSKSKKSFEKVPPVMNKIIKKCKELHPDVECDKKLLNNVSLNMFKNKEITKKEREDVFNYLKDKK